MKGLAESPLRNLTWVIGFVLAVVAVSTLAYMHAGWSFGDAVYMVLLTVYTVGYGEVRPIDTPYLHGVTITTMILGCTGMILVTGALVQTLTVIQLKQLLGSNRMKSDIEKLKGHVIVCGFGRIGVMLAKDLVQGGSPFVILERSEKRFAEAQELGYLCLQGDATDEETLLAAGIKEARILATVLPDDAANVFITLSARSLNPSLQIIARGEAPSTESKLIQAGADKVVLPTHIGAERIAEMILFPETARFIRGSERMQDFEKVLRDLGLSLEMAVVSGGSAAVGQTIDDIEKRGKGAFFVVQIDLARRRGHHPPGRRDPHRRRRRAGGGGPHRQRAERGVLGAGGQGAGGADDVLDMKRPIPWLAALCLVCVMAPMAAKTAQGDETHRLIAVDGPRRLSIDCMGSGEPTIVFDAGYGSVSANWRPVQAALALHNRACAYDRAGMSHSDGPSRPTTPANVVDDLHRLIRAARIKTPIVLVGHSRGGFYATLYTLTYRSDIAALVLVDPAFAQNIAEYLAISPSERDYVNANNPKGRANLVRCEALAEKRALSVADPQGCFSVSASDTAAFRDAWITQGVKPQFYQALISEFDASLAGLDNARIIAAERASQHPFGDLPLVVLTSDKPMQTGAPNPSDNAAADRIWKHGHDRLASYSSRGQSLIVPKTSHMIQVDDPQAVADAVKTVLGACCRAR